VNNVGVSTDIGRGTAAEALASPKRNPALALAARPPARGDVQMETSCFACGRDNPNGLQIHFEIDATGAAAASWVPARAWEGFENVIHGGILTTAMDEAMAKAVVAAGIQGLTCELRIRLHHSVNPGSPLHIRGWIVRVHRRLVRTEASICSPAGNEYAHAWASFLMVPQVRPRHAS
jgi:acyl-coenzyme A thioesterase PaaI-like protein